MLLTDAEAEEPEEEDDIDMIAEEVKMVKVHKEIMAEKETKGEAYVKSRGSKRGGKGGKEEKKTFGLHV